jgi:hypothetical protein
LQSAPYEIALDERYLRTQRGRRASRDEPGRASADDDKIVHIGRIGIAPRGWMNILLERAMVAIVWRSARRRSIVLHGMRLLRGRMRHGNQPPVKPARCSPLLI